MPASVCLRNKDVPIIWNTFVWRPWPNVHDSLLVWGVQHLGFLQADGSWSPSWLRLGCCSPPAPAGAQEHGQMALVQLQGRALHSPPYWAARASVSHSQEKLMSCTGKKLRVAALQCFLSMLSVSVLGCCGREGAVVLSLCWTTKPFHLWEWFQTGWELLELAERTVGKYSIWVMNFWFINLV